MNYAESIREQAERTAPQECCGVLTRRSGQIFAVECPNRHENPRNCFRIAVADYEPYFRNGSLVGFYHSHVAEDEEPSEADKAASEAANLMSVTYSLLTHRFHTYPPVGYVSPLEGRDFVFGIHDCVALVIDYKRQVQNRLLPSLPRTLKDMASGYLKLPEYLQKAGLVQVATPEKHDIVLMCCSDTGIADHAGIYLGDGLLLHHVIATKSRKSIYGSYWTERTVGFYR